MYEVAAAGKVFQISVEDGTVQVAGSEKTVDYLLGADDSGHLLIDGRSVEFAVVAVEGGTWSVSLDGRTYDVVVKSRKEQLLEKFGGAAGGTSRHRDIKAPMPGLVLRLEVEEGQSVKAGEPLLVLEAMKMENELTAPSDGVVEAIHVSAGDAVSKNALLIEIGSDHS